MTKLKGVYLMVALCSIIIQVIQCADSKCNLTGTKLICTDVNNDELVENIKKHQPTHFECNECTSSKLNFQQLDIDTRKKLQKITIIELLTQLDLDLDTFKGVENIEVITFVNTSIKALEPELFQPLSKLVEANFINCDVRKTVDHIFKHTPQLQKLAITKTLIYNVRPIVFEETQNLVELDFSENHMQTIDKDSFKLLTKLEKIVLHKNDLKVLPTELFDNQPALKYIDISHNPINQIDIKHIIETNKKLDVFKMHDLPCQTFESAAEVLATGLQFQTECAQEGKDGPYAYKTSCVKLLAYDKRTPNEKLTVFEADNDGVSDNNFSGLPCVSNDKVKDVFRPLPSA